MNRFILFAALIVLSTTKVSSAELNYDVTVGFIGSGNLSIKKIYHGIDDFSLLIEGDVKVPFKQIHYYTKTRYKNAKLIHAQVTKTVNNQVKENTIVELINNQYTVTKDDKKKHHLQTNIAFSVAMLYNREPVNLKSIFSEKFGEFCKIETVEKGVYKLHLPDGITSLYHYAHGICTYVKTRFMGQNVEFKLK